MKLENALVALDLYLSQSAEWESAMRPDGNQPCGEPPSDDRGIFAHVYSPSRRTWSSGRRQERVSGA